MSIDVGRCDRVLMPFSQVSVAPIFLSVALWQIYKRMGTAMFGAIGVTVFFMIINIAQGRVMGQFRAKIARKTDRRVRLLEEMITSMRIIKMYVWEGFFLSRLIGHRKAEMWKQRMKLSFYGFCDSILRSSR